MPKISNVHFEYTFEIIIELTETLETPFPNPPIQKYTNNLFTVNIQNLLVINPDD